MKATFQSQASNQNEIYTYIAIPIEALQQTSEQGVQSLTVAQNVILKALPDGNISQQIQPITVPENVIFRAISKEKKTDQIVSNLNNPTTKSVEKSKESLVLSSSTRPSVIEQNNSNQSCGAVRKSVILKSGLNKPESINSDKSGVRYLKCKTPQVSNGSYTRSKESGSFKCSICGEVLKKVMLYRKHMEMHRNMKKYKCEQCSASYNVEDNLKLHMAMHSKTEPTCPICNRKFQRLASLKAHIIIHEVEEIFTCVECLAEYEKEDDLNKHMQSHKKEKTDSGANNLPLECSFCSHTFQDANQYKEHISFHIKIKRLVMNGKKHKRRVNTNRDHPYKCEVCKKSFLKYCLLERHMRIHSGEKPFACHLCDRAFNQKGTLQIHLARHSGIKPFQCTLCPAKFCQKGNLRVHVQKTHIALSPGEKAFKCSMCTCIFKKVSSLNAHITRAHAAEKQGDDILEVLAQLKELEKRLEFNSDTSKTEINPNSIILKDNIVEIKNNTVGVENNPVKYVRLIDTSIEGTTRKCLVKQRKIGDTLWYICSSCSKGFKKPSDLIRHTRVHTKEKPFQCKHCDQAFSLKSTLTTHMATHIGKRQYQCVICLKAFTSVRSLNVHLRRHEKRSQQYMCSTCNMVFNTILKAKMHMDLHKIDPVNSALSKPGELRVVMQQPMVETPNGLLPVAAPKSQVYATEADSLKNRPHKCHYCSAAFTKGVHLKRHMLIHSGERKFKCNICSKSFYSSYALKEHLKFHSGERNFSCKVCGKKFVTNAILKRHLTIHSSSTPYVCPYCRKHFKTVLLCRKHIKIHKRDFSLQIHALNETGELANIEDPDVVPTLDLNVPLSDNQFSAIIPDAASSLGLSIENLSNETEIPTTIPALEENPVTLSQKSKTETAKDLQQNKDNSVSKILYTDENGIIISANLENQSLDVDNELQNALGQQFYQTSMIPQNYIDRTTNLALLSETTTPSDLGNAEDAITTLSQENLPDDTVGPTVYINCDDLQAFTTASLYNACLAQLKNNDPLLMSGINEIQDPNILFSADPTLNQIADSQLDPQAFEMLMPTFTLYNNMALSTNSLSGLNASFPNIVLSNIEDCGDGNQTVLSDINEINKKAEMNLLSLSNNKTCEGNASQNLEIEPNSMDLNDESIAAINQESTVLSNLLYSGVHQLEVNSNATIDTATVDGDGSINACEESSAESQNSESNSFKKVDFACSRCKATLKCMADLKFHSCVKNINFKVPKEKGKILRSKSKQTTKKSSAKNVKPWSVSLLKSRNVTQSKQNEDTSVDSCVSDKADLSTQYKCTHCDKASATKNALARHMLMHKDKKGPANKVCSYCSKVFKKHSDLERHIRTHTGEKPFGCDKCGKSFSLKSTLESHYRTHNPGGNKDFSCAVCSSYFSSKSSLRVHMLMHTGVKPYQCSLCPEKFRTSGHRKSHMANHLKTTESKKSTHSRSAKVNSLLASAVMDSQNTLQISQENASVLNNMQLPSEAAKKDDSQLMVQETDRDVLYSSQTIQVDPLFLQQLQLNNVLLQDNAEDLSFVQVDINSEGQITNMKSLLNNADGDISNFDDPIYETVVTEKEKPQSSLYFTRKVVPVTKHFVCDVCHKRYSTKSILAKHKKIHGVGNSFKCTKCDTAFESGEELENHLKLHSGYRPYCCQLCANTFSEEKNLKTHMRRIHGNVL